MAGYHPWFGQWSTPTFIVGYAIDTPFFQWGCVTWFHWLVCKHWSGLTAVRYSIVGITSGPSGLTDRAFIINKKFENLIIIDTLFQWGCAGWFHWLFCAHWSTSTLVHYFIVATMSGRYWIYLVYWVYRTMAWTETRAIMRHFLAFVWREISKTFQTIPVSKSIVVSKSRVVLKFLVVSKSQSNTETRARMRHFLVFVWREIL